MYRMAVYGKGGIGKSTTVSNVAAALAADGMTVLQIGCDPKADSTIAHTAGVRIQSVLDVLRHKNASAVRLEDIVTRARDGVWCAEAGGPTPGTGCAGRGIVAAFESLTACRAFEEIKPDVVLYDVLGDVVCGGFAMPIRKGSVCRLCLVSLRRLALPAILWRSLFCFPYCRTFLMCKYSGKIKKAEQKNCSASKQGSYQSIFSKSSFPTPQRGHTQSSGMSSNFVPGAMPCSGSPISGS